MPHDLKVRLNVEKEQPHSHSAHGGRALRRCRRCGNQRGPNRKYGLDMCRRCLHENASKIGFKVYD